MTDLPSNVRLKAVGTSPNAPAWHRMMENAFLKKTFVTSSIASELSSISEAERRNSALTELPHGAFLRVLSFAVDSVSIANLAVSMIAAPRAQKRSMSQGIDPFYRTFINSQPYNWLPLAYTLAPHAANFLTSLLTKSNTSTLETYAAVFVSNSSVTTIEYDEGLEPLPSSEIDPLSRFEKYSVADWDGYGAEPITEETVDAARRFMALLPNTLGESEVAPGADGIVAFEWVFRTGPLRKLFIDIGPGNVWSAYYRRADGQKRTFQPQPIEEDTKGLLDELFHNLSV